MILCEMYCDQCNSLQEKNVGGHFNGDLISAIDAGWEDRDGIHICLECQDKEMN